MIGVDVSWNAGFIDHKIDRHGGSLLELQRPLDKLHDDDDDDDEWSSWERQPRTYGRTDCSND